LSVTKKTGSKTRLFSFWVIRIREEVERARREQCAGEGERESERERELHEREKENFFFALARRQIALKNIEQRKRAPK